MSTPRTRLLRASLALLPALWLAGCGGGGSDPAGPVLNSLTAAPAAVSLQPGGTQDLVITGHFSNSSAATLTTGVTFTSNATGVATVSPAGRITAVAVGNATVTATSAGKSVDVPVSVTAPSTAGLVFGDDYAAGVSFVAFGGSTNALSVDATEHHAGTASLRIEVPASNYTGGALVASADQDLSTFNAVTFWAKASRAATLNVTGLGNDAGAGPSWSAELLDVPLTTAWTKFTIPLPVPAKATAVDGLFHFAEGADGAAYTIWLDDVQYENLPGASLAAPSAAAVTWLPVNVGVGETVTLPAGANTVNFPLPSLTLANVAFRWFTLTSSAPDKATVNADGVIAGVAAGTAGVSAQLGPVAVAGSAAVTVLSSVPAPTTVAAAPTAAAADVISLFSSAYTNRTIDTWKTSWTPAGTTLVDPYAIPGASPAHDVKKYVFTPGANFSGVEFTGANVIDATGMTHFHVDVWTPDVTEFQVKLVDFGADGAFGGGDDTEGLFAAHAGSTPALTGTAQWVSLDIPLDSFTKLTGPTWNRAHLAQMVLVAPAPAGGGTVYLDNLYFSRAGGGGATQPTTAPAAPTAAPADVISLLSKAYTNVGVDTWRTSWSQATLADVTIGGDPMKEYTGLDVVGIETTGANLIDATAMTHFHVDVWTPNATTLKVKLVDFGADGAFAGGDDTEHELVFNAGSTPALATGAWVSLDLPLSSFTGLTNRAHMAQLIFAGVPTGAATLYVDNVYFHKAAVAPVAPATAPPAPASAQADVISLLSSAYTGVALDTWGTSWSNGNNGPNLTELVVDGAPVKKYSPLAFVGIEFTGANLIDATAMTHFHVDVWTPDISNFQVKLVDFGADAAFAGGDDTEGLFTAHAATTPALTGTGQWVSLDIPLDAFTKLTGPTWNRAHLAQLLFISGTGSGTAFVGNVYFHK